MIGWLRYKIRRLRWQSQGPHLSLGWYPTLEDIDKLMRQRKEWLSREPKRKDK
jgi:hypothetical protein